MNDWRIDLSKKNGKRIRFFILIEVLGVILVAGAHPLYAQEKNPVESRVFGWVRLEGGFGSDKASVVFSNSSRKFEAVSDSQGNWAISLPSGIYQVRVSGKGAESQVVKDLQVEGKELKLEFTLKFAFTDQDLVFQDALLENEVPMDHWMLALQPELKPLTALRQRSLSNSNRAQKAGKRPSRRKSKVARASL